MRTPRLAHAFLFVLSILSANGATAATIYVSTTVDDFTVNGNCSLREAIVAANTDRAVDTCPAGAGADAILVPGGTYLLSIAGPNDDNAYTGDLDVAGETTIYGSGAGQTVIDGGSFDYLLGDRVIHVLRTGNLALVGTTIRGGRCGSGAGILNGGTLSVEESRIEGNLGGLRFDYCSAVSEGVDGFGGGGILNGPAGRLVVSRSAVSANDVGEDDPGGGLINFGAATIEGSVFSGHTGAVAGAILNLGNLEIVDSQIASNFARFGGAALVNLRNATFRRTTVGGNITAGSGGALINGVWGHPEAVLEIETSTISGNIGYSGWGALINYEGHSRISSSTIAGNVGGFEEGAVGGITSADVAATSLTATILANAGSNCAGPAISLGNNLASDASCGLSAAGDLPDTDPLIGPLADNGGPTPTHALLAGSPAIDLIPAAQCVAGTDQRQALRPNMPNGYCDVGAYEFSLYGEMRFLIESVRALSNSSLLTKDQSWALIRLLVSAATATLVPNLAAAGSALDDFVTVVTGYIDDGSLPNEPGEALLLKARRVRSFLGS